MNTQETLVKARIQLLFDRCFYGSLALNLKLEESKECSTFSTDGKTIFYNKAFVDSLKDTDKQFILTHEILHLIYYHLSRRQERDFKLWNESCDIVVNNTLREEFGYIPKGVIDKPEYIGLSAEEVYLKLSQQQQQQQQQQGNNKGDGSEGEQQQKKGKGKGKGKKQKQEQQQPEGSEGKGEMPSDEDDFKPFDEHKDIIGNTSEIDELEKDWKMATVKAAEIAKGRGKLPGYLDIFIKNLLSPKIDWRTLLKQFVSSVAQSDYKMLPPNKRYIHQDLYMPSLTSEALGDVVVIIDNSGSTQEYQQRFISECNYMLHQYDMNLHLITCDTEVNSYNVYHKGDTIKLNYKGVGGTDIRAAFDHLKKLYIMPSIIICLTDADTPFPSPIHYPTVWVLPYDAQIPFGYKIII